MTKVFLANSVINDDSGQFNQGATLNNLKHVAGRINDSANYLAESRKIYKDDRKITTAIIWIDKKCENFADTLYDHLEYGATRYDNSNIPVSPAVPKTKTERILDAIIEHIFTHDFIVIISDELGSRDVAKSFSKYLRLPESIGNYKEYLEPLDNLNTLSYIQIEMYGPEFAIHNRPLLSNDFYK